MVELLKTMGFTRSADLRSYLYLRGYAQVLSVRTLAGHSKGSAFCVKEFARSTEIFVVNQGTYLHFKYDEVDQLEIAQVVEETKL